LARSDAFSRVLRPAALRLIPSAQALQPALEASQRLFRQTLAPIRDQLRPFSRQVRPTVRHLKQTAEPLRRTAKGLRNSFSMLNVLLNLLAFNPSGEAREGFLFYLPWLNHAFNSIYLTQDAGGPVRRGLLIFTCNTVRLAEFATEANDLLKTALQATQVPTSAEICPPPPTP
jgi:phospholipid/cholesterol/gamma-HCH transport system substrate-binding protein